MKIGFTIDTNILRGNNNPSIEGALKYYGEYINNLGKTGCKNTLELIITQVVIDEYLAQRKRQLEEQYNEIVSQCEKMKDAIIGDIPKNAIDQHIKSQRNICDKYCGVIPLEYTEECFNKLVNDAIEKKPPFDKSEDGKKTDAGFKDALIWNSILNSKVIDKYDILYCASKDKVMKNNREVLTKEFSNHHPHTEVRFIKPEQAGREQQEVLETIIAENKLMTTATVELYSKELIFDAIKNLKYSPDDFLQHDREAPALVLFRDFTYDDFSIDDVIQKDKEKEEYSVLVTIYTNKYLPGGNVATEPRDNLIGSVILEYEKKDSKLRLVDSKVASLKYVNLASYLASLVSAASALNKTSIVNSFNIQAGTDALSKLFSNYGDLLKIAKPDANIIPDCLKRPKI